MKLSKKIILVTIVSSIFASTAMAASQNITSISNVYGSPTYHGNFDGGAGNNTSGNGNGSGNGSDGNNNGSSNS